MRNYLRRTPKMRAIVIFIFVLFIVAVLIFFLKPIPLPLIPEDILTESDITWEKHMLAGDGAYYTSTGGYRPPFSDDKDSFRQSILTALWGESGILIDSQRFDGDYMRMQGGPLDIIEGDTIEYVLYGKEVGQFHIPSRFAWNDEYNFSYADYYLLRRNNSTKEGEIIKEWLNVPNSYGYLLYDTKTNLITIDLCAVGAEQIKVDDELQTKSLGYGGFNIICTSN